MPETIYEQIQNLIVKDLSDSIDMDEFSLDDQIDLYFETLKEEVNKRIKS